VILCGQELSLLAVDRSTGGGEDNLPQTVRDAVLEEAARAQHVHFCIEVRPSYRAYYDPSGPPGASASGPKSSKTSSHPDLMSISENRTCLDTFSRLPVDRLSTTATSWPRTRRLSAMCDPRTPTRQVSRTCTSRDLKNILGEPLEGSLRSFARRYARLPTQRSDLSSSKVMHAKVHRNDSW
jgi:hypothetical protein